MTFSIPSLNSYASQDTNYIVKLNGDKAALDNSFLGIQSDIAAVQTATGTAFLEDWGRKGPVSEAWPDGVLGAYSLVLDTSDLSNGNVSLVSENQSSQSVCILGGKRRFVLGNLSASLSSITGDANYTVYLGVEASGELGLAAKLDVTQGNVPLALYSLPLNLASGVWTVQASQTPTRIARTVYWDNTVEQLRQETPQVFHMNLTYINGYLNPNHGGINKITIPYDHIWEDSRLSCTVTTAGGGTGTITLDIDGGATVLSADCTTAGNSITMPVQSPYIGTAMAANTVYSAGMDFTTGTVQNGQLSLFVRRAYNAPLAN